ncbi:hypothetical protein [Streptomyces venezuelae]|uniref:hypothetical protein n=1 Tax=Streptomyces venezuelae TaxID=54571 RepID=UPI00341C5D5E
MATFICQLVVGLVERFPAELGVGVLGEQLLLAASLRVAHVVEGPRERLVASGALVGGALADEGLDVGE